MSAKSKFGCGVGMEGWRLTVFVHLAPQRLEPEHNGKFLRAFKQNSDGMRFEISFPWGSSVESTG